MSDMRHSHALLYQQMPRLFFFHMTTHSCHQIGTNLHAFWVDHTATVGAHSCGLESSGQRRFSHSVAVARMPSRLERPAKPHHALIAAGPTRSPPRAMGEHVCGPHGSSRSWCGEWSPRLETMVAACPSESYLWFFFPFNFYWFPFVLIFSFVSYLRKEIKVLLISPSKTSPSL